MSDAGPAGFLSRAASLFAIAGGLVLCVLAGVTVVSVTGRALFSTPIPGDFELVAVGTAVVAFLCLPYCQLQRGNIRIELFMGHASPRITGVLDAIGGLLSAALAALFAGRMLFGFIDAWRDHDVTIILGLPLWWAYPFGISSFALLTACCLQTAGRDVQQAFRATDPTRAR